MHLIKPSAHRVLDVVTVAIFAAAPSVVGFERGARALSYGLAAVHLMMTLATRFGTDRRPVPLAVHGHVEIVVAAALLIVAAVAPWPMPDRWFFAGAGLVIGAVWALSDYGHEHSHIR